MATFITWMTDVFDLSFTVGADTVTLGYVLIAGLVIGAAIRAYKKLGSRA